AANCATTTARDPEIIDPITVECVKWLKRNTETLRSGVAWDKRSREQLADRDRWEHRAKEEPLEGAPGRRRAHQGRHERIRLQVPRLRLVNAQTPMQSITEGGRDGREHANKPRNAQVGIAGSWATQQPQRGGTTSCASMPSAGIDRVKCLISLKAAGEQSTDSSLVGATIPATWPTGRGKWQNESGSGPGAPCVNIFWGF